MGVYEPVLATRTTGEVPSKFYPVVVRFTDSELHQLTKEAMNRGIARSELIRLILNDVRVPITKNGGGTKSLLATTGEAIQERSELFEIRMMRKNKKGGCL